MGTDNKVNKIINIVKFGLLTLDLIILEVLIYITVEHGVLYYRPTQHA